MSLLAPTPEHHPLTVQLAQYLRKQNVSLGYVTGFRSDRLLYASHFVPFVVGIAVARNGMPPPEAPEHKFFDITQVIEQVGKNALRRETDEAGFARRSIGYKQRATTMAQTITPVQVTTELAHELDGLGNEAYYTATDMLLAFGALAVESGTKMSVLTTHQVERSESASPPTLSSVKQTGNSAA